MNAIAALLALCSEYGRAAGVEPSTVSWRVFGDTKKLQALAGSADIQVRRCERAVQWLSDHWPEGAEWPDDVERPARVAAE